MTFLLILLTSLCSAKSPMELALERHQIERTKEYVVNIDGASYHKIEYKGESFYFTVLQKKEEVPKYLCERPEGWRSERLVEASLKIRRRKVLFFQALRDSCTTRDEEGRDTGSRRTSVEIDPVIGIHLPEGKEDLIKNKKLGIPLNKPSQIMFSGEF